MSYKIVGVGPDYIEIWDGVSFTAPGKTVNEAATIKLHIGIVVGLDPEWNDCVGRDVEVVLRLVPLPDEEDEEVESTNQGETSE